MIYGDSAETDRLDILATPDAADEKGHPFRTDLVPVVSVDLVSFGV